jgi:nicotinamidase-related amidase
MSKKVLVVVDVQNDFVNGGALPYRYPGKSNTDLICNRVRKAIEDGDYVVATRDTHHDNYFETLEGKNLPVMHCIHDTHGWELVDRLKALAAENKIVVFDKSTFGTPLVAEYIRNLLESDEIKEVELIGYDLSICLLANAVILRSHFPNKKITVLKELCGDVDEVSFNAAIKVLQNQQIEVV